MISALYILDHDADEIVRQIRAARPELKVDYLSPDADNTAILPNSALLSFGMPEKARTWSNLIWIHSSGAGVDGIMRHLPPNVKWVTRSIGTLGTRMGDFCLAYILFFAQRIAVRYAHQVARTWNKNDGMPITSRGQTALVLGTGEMGAAIAEVLSANGIKTIGCSRSGKHVPPFDSCLTPEGVPAMAKTCDYVIAALPLTEETTGFCDAEFFAPFENTLFINVGRGGSVDEAGLLSALDQAQVRHAVLDVFETEPLPSSSPLWTHDKIFITPHVSGVTQPHEAAGAFLEHLAAFERGETGPYMVDFERGY